MTEESAAPSTLSPSFRRVFDGEFDYVCRALRRLGVVQGDVEDVAQEVFLSVHAQLDSYETDRPLKPWLFAFALRFAANYRRLARHRDVEADDDLHHAVPSHEANAHARDIVLRSLGKLDFDQRVVFVMHDLEGFGASEIAEEVAIPLNTVYSRLRLAREDFRKVAMKLQTKGGAS